MGAGALRRAPAGAWLGGALRSCVGEGSPEGVRRSSPHGGLRVSEEGAAGRGSEALHNSWVCKDASRQPFPPHRGAAVTRLVI